MVTRSRQVKQTEESNLLKEIAGRMEIVRDRSAANMFDRLMRMRKVLGKRPYNGLPVDPGELMARYMQIRNDPETSMQVAEQNVKQRKDGRMLISKEFIKSIIDSETKLRKGGL